MYLVLSSRSDRVSLISLTFLKSTPMGLWKPVSNSGNYFYCIPRQSLETYREKANPQILCQYLLFNHCH